MTKLTASTTTNYTSVRTDHLGFLVDSSSSSKSVIGRPVESFSNIIATDRIIKKACNIGGAIQPSFQRLLLEIPTDDDRLAVANFIIKSYHDRNISVKTKCAYITCLVYLFCIPFIIGARLPIGTYRVSPDRLLEHQKNLIMTSNKQPWSKSRFALKHDP